MRRGNRRNGRSSAREGRGKKGGRDGGRGAWRVGGSALAPQGVLGVQAGTGTRLQLCLPFPPLPACRSGSGAGAQPWAPVGGPHSRQPGPACPHCSLGSGGCWLAKPPLAWKTQPSPGWELGKWLQAGSSVFTGAQEFAWRDNQLSPQDLAHYSNIKIKWDIETAVLKLLKGSEQM